MSSKSRGRRNSLARERTAEEISDQAAAVARARRELLAGALRPQVPHPPAALAMLRIDNPMAVELWTDGYTTGWLAAVERIGRATGRDT